MLLSAAPVFAQTARPHPQPPRSRRRRSRRRPRPAPAAARRPPRRAAAGAVPGGRENRVRQPAARRSRTRPTARPPSTRVQRADPEEADRRRGQGQAAAGQPAEAADQRQRDERAARVAAREGNRAADSRGRALPAGRAGRDQRAAAGSCRTSSQKKLLPIVEQVAKEKGLHILFSRGRRGDRRGPIPASTSPPTSSRSSTRWRSRAARRPKLAQPDRALRD